MSKTLIKQKNEMIESKEYTQFLVSIKERVRKAQYDALKKVNKELINLYWDIGSMIVERQKKYGWGKAIVENLSKDLQVEFAGVKGFSVQNLWYMRKFYLIYNDNEKLQLLVGEISWAKNMVIMEYALKDSKKPIGVATYLLQKELPKKLAKYLPSGEELAKKLDIIDS
ncbi:DUF1016 N-terminal domain-containing protein [bacterium]